MKRLVPYAVIAALLVLTFQQGGRETVRTERHVDTLIVRDTVRDTLLIPQSVYVVRTDTVLLRLPADTVVREVAVPVERREYLTDHYHAVIEGYRPELVRMEVWPETRYVTRTEVSTVKRTPRLGVGIQAGYGIGPHGAGPYVGVGMQYNLFSF